MVDNLSEALEIIKKNGKVINGRICKELALGNCKKCIIEKFRKSSHLEFMCAIPNSNFITEIIEAEVRKQKLRKLLA